MVLKYLTLKNEMEWALREISKESKQVKKCEHCGQSIPQDYVDPKSGKGLKIPEDVRIGEDGAEIMLAYAVGYIKAVTKIAYGLMSDMSKRSTIKHEEVRIAVEAVTRVDIEREVRRGRKIR